MPEYYPEDHNYNKPLLNYHDNYDKTNFQEVIVLVNFDCDRKLDSNSFKNNEFKICSKCINDGYLYACEMKFPDGKWDLVSIGADCELPENFLTENNFMLSFVCKNENEYKYYSEMTFLIES